VRIEGHGILCYLLLSLHIIVVNRTIRMSPFEVVHNYQSRQPIDLILMVPHYTRMSESAASFSSHFHDPHKDTNTQIQKSNVNYKSYADLHKKAQEFDAQEGTRV